MGSSNDSYEQRKATIRRAKRIKRTVKLVFSYILVLTLCITGIWLTVVIYDQFKEQGSVPSEPSSSTPSSSGSTSVPDPAAVAALSAATVPEDVKVDIIPVGGIRSGDKLTAITGIVIHYVGEPGKTAEKVREDFSLADSTASTHFVIGLDGEVIQCLPLDEQAVASGARNADTISIEVCHTSADGLFNTKAYESLTKLSAWLLKTTGLTADACYRHYDVTEADCPPHYVSNQSDWDKLKADIASRLG